MARAVGFIFYVPARLLAAAGLGSVRADVDAVAAACAACQAEALPSVLYDMTILVEDRRFYLHAGVDPHGIARALVNNLRGGALQGGSTLEQQLVRSVTERREVTVRRKVREAMVATIVSRQFRKEEIVHALLHRCWFGPEWRGARAVAAANGADLTDLSPAQAASIVARIRYPEPSDVSPVYREKVRRRVEYVLRAYESLQGHAEA